MARGYAVLALGCLLLACCSDAVQSEPSPEVIAAARLKAAELCGWSEPAAGRKHRRMLAQELVVEPQLNTEQFYLKAGSPAADVVELARRLCSEKEVEQAKQLEEVRRCTTGASHRHSHTSSLFVACVYRTRMRNSPSRFFVIQYPEGGEIK